MPVDDIYRVTLTTVLDNEFTNPFRNVFYFRISSLNNPPDEVDDLAAAFDFTLLPLIRAVTSEALSFETLELLNISQPPATALFGQFAYSSLVTGDVIGPYEPRFVSWGFRLNRRFRATRNGYKRFGGVASSNVSDGVATSGILPDLIVLQNALGTFISDGSSNISAFPHIVRLTPTGGPAVINPVANAVFYGVTTQNSRKR